MTSTQRMKNDVATMDRREMADKTIKDSRAKNDEMTAERRFQADKTMDDNRLKNDVITANRRDANDWNSEGMALAMTLVVLATLAVVVYFVLV